MKSLFQSACLFVGVLVGCVSPTQGALPSMPVRPAVRLTHNDSGKQVTLAPNDILEIGLDRNAGTGYDWQILSVNDSVLRLQSHQSDSANPVPGASNTETFKFQAVGVGLSTVVQIGYKPWWNPQVEPATLFQAVVIVSGTPVPPTLKPTQVGIPKPLETLTQLTLQDTGKEIAVPRASLFQVNFDLDGKSAGAWEIMANNHLGVQLVSIGIVYPGGTPAVTMPRQTFTFKANATTGAPLRLGFKDWANETGAPKPVFDVFIVTH